MHTNTSPLSEARHHSTKDALEFYFHPTATFAPTRFLLSVSHIPAALFSLPRGEAARIGEESMG